ncbi:MAG: phage/plasmid primase, P4 family [Lachnospiraceae bacterium]|nr:phage/plasmid primase, P4 family [Lachnospiraceae bacterium]
MKLILQTADVVSDAKNCRYPNRVSVMSAEELQAAVRFDHVCAEYKDNYRSVGNFIRSNVIVMDCDNDHSENPEEWITAEKMKKLFEDYSFAVAPSRHHMIPKDGKAARPKYHVYFEINETEDAEYYAALKRAIQKVYPFFDGNALDAARFIFGADCGEVCWHEGWNTIDEEVEVLAGTGDEDADDCSWRPDGKISQGTRNRTLSHFAGRALKRFGETEKAKKIFLEEAAKCDPPLDKEELKTIWHSALKFYRNTVQTQEGYVEPDEYNSDFRDGSLKPGDYSDIGQAKALIMEYGGELRFSEATDFLRYDGQAWIEDKQYAVGALEEFLDLQLEDANDCVQRLAEALVTSGVDEETVKAGGKPLEKAVTGKQIKLFHAYIAARGYLAFVMKRRDWKYVASALNVAKPMILINVNSLDTDENLLNTPEATFDLKKGLAGGKPHDPADYITKCTACAPGEDGKKLWEDALDLFFCGDKSLIAYVQQIVGMAAVGRVYQEHLIIAYGSGANGKSTFWNTVARVMGTYSGKLSAETLTMNCKRNVKPEMAELKGRRLIISSEMQEGMRLNTSMVKQLCSTDEIFAEKKYKAPFAFSPSHTLVLYTNHLPKVGATDDGIWRRLIVIPFNAKIEGKNDIKNYSEYLFENAGAAIMAWIIEGAKKAIDMHFHTPLPKVVQDAIDAYREENNWLGHFISECCDVDPSYKEKSGQFYQQYRAYCIQSGEYTRSTTDFYTAVENAGYVRRKTSAGMMIYGLKLKDGQDFL